jgi:hypothetical protein
MSRPAGIATLGGALAALLVVAGIYFGSGQFSRFDTPLAAYAAATVFAAFAIAYRYLMWIQRPPTWRYFVASWRVFLRPRSLVRNVARLAVLFWDSFVAQRFIERRSRTRWVAHLAIAWGCILAFAITFPLSWGWVQFSSATDGRDYVAEVFGRPVLEFSPGSFVGFLFFNGLNISAALVLLGVGLAMHRRLFERGAHAVQNLSNDLVPLFLLFSVSITGLMLTASYKLMGGENFSFLSLLHAFTVVLLLLYLPFGKLFHVIQRPAQLGVEYYKEEAARSGPIVCPRSGEAFMSKMHYDDLATVMKQVGQDFGWHQALSPEEKRKLIAVNQAALFEERPFVG